MLLLFFFFLLISLIFSQYLFSMAILYLKYLFIFSVYSK
ncbi:MAG: conjugal transfer protein [Dielma fastidiosa]|nr:MAG: conjugal transfer protein [Dielma fastidiosa]